MNQVKQQAHSDEWTLFTVAEKPMQIMFIRALIPAIIDKCNGMKREEAIDYWRDHKNIYALMQAIFTQSECEWFLNLPQDYKRNAIITVARNQGVNKKYHKGFMVRYFHGEGL